MITNRSKDKTPVVGLYMIRDIKARRYFSPFSAENKDVAARHFSQMISQSNTIFANNPTDFELFEIGDFDASDGQIDLFDQYDYICSGADIIAS